MQKNHLVKVLLTLLLLVSLSACTLTTCLGSEVHDVAVVDVTVFPTWTFPNHLTGVAVDINATVENQGTSYETFDVTAYFNNHSLPPLAVIDLAPGLNTTLTFKLKFPEVRILIFPPPWPDPTKPIIENLTIRVEADVVPGEVDTADNVYVDGIVRVIWVPIDFDGDGTIGMRDIAATARIFGTYEGHPTYDPMLDFNQDGRIDMRDISLSARNFGLRYV